MAGQEPEYPSPPARSMPHSILTGGGILLAIAGLYFGQELFIPFTLAVLLAFALSPIINALRRWRVPRVAAVIITVILAFSVIGGLSYVLSTQVIKLAESIPRYQYTMINKIDSIFDSGAAGGLFERLTSTLERLRSRLADNEETSQLGSPAQPSEQDQEAPEPIPVIIEAQAGSAMDVLRAFIGPLIKPLATTGLVVVFVLFVLLEREDLRDRFIKLVGAGDLQTSTEALGEAGDRVSRYLLMQLTVNIAYGVPLGVGLYIIGVPNAVLWGLLAVILRFLPYLGPFLAALLPMALAFAVDPGWSMLLWVAGLFLVMELVSNNIIEPWLYGASTGLSALAIIASAIFWTMLWGPVGLIMSTPLTVCLIVIGRYVPQLNFLGILLGSDPVLAPEEQLYQRLLAGNHEGAIEIAERYIDQHSSQAFYDQVAIPALRMAEDDRQRNASDGIYKRTVGENMNAVIEELADFSQQHKSGEEETEAREDAPTPIRVQGEPCLCIGGKTDLDRAAAEMVAQVVRERGIGARVLPPIAVGQHGINRIDLAGVDVVCLSYLAHQPQTFASFASRRLKRRAPHLKVLVCLWNPSIGADDADEMKTRTGADAVVSSLMVAAAQIGSWIAPPIMEPMQAAPIPENEQDRLEALRRLGLVTTESSHFDEVAAKVAAVFGTQIALVSVVDEAHQHWPGATGLPPGLDVCRMEARETSICGHVVALGEMVVVEDVAKDPRFANNPFLIEKGIRFYAGAPLKTKAGFTVGSLCVIDPKPRAFGRKDRALLQKIADDVMGKVELECERAGTQPRHSAVAAVVTPPVIASAQGPAASNAR